MTARSLSQLEAKLISAFRVLPEGVRLQLFQIVDHLAEKIEDQEDAKDADRILHQIESGGEELISIDEMARSLGLPVKKR